MQTPLFRFCVLTLLALFFNLATTPLHAQSKAKKGQSPIRKQKKYTQEEVLDSLNGILIYDHLIPAIGGDSTRLQKNGETAQGWVEDLYENGKTLHKGLYKDGKLVLFKNFYANGKTERVFASLDSLNCNMEIFYENGNQRKQINYYKGKPKRISEFYETGLLKQTEEFNNDNQLLIMRKTWYIGGQIMSETYREPKTGKYNQKNYYRNGKLSEQGTLIFDKETKELVRNGAWTSQDSTGKNKKSINYKLPKKASN